MRGYQVCGVIYDPLHYEYVRFSKKIFLSKHDAERYIELIEEGRVQFLTAKEHSWEFEYKKGTAQIIEVTIEEVKE